MQHLDGSLSKDTFWDDDVPRDSSKAPIFGDSSKRETIIVELSKRVTTLEKNAIAMAKYLIQIVADIEQHQEEQQLVQRSRAYGRTPGELTRGQLDSYCQPIFEQMPKATEQAIMAIVRRIETDQALICDRRKMTSQVRKWFRKSREEEGRKILMALEKVCKDEYEKRDAGNYGSPYLAAVMQESKSLIINQDALQIFAVEKIASFLERNNDRSKPTTGQ